MAGVELLFANCNRPIILLRKIYVTIFDQGKLRAALKMIDMLAFISSNKILPVPYTWEFCWPHF
jgi:hypothetical protein